MEGETQKDVSLTMSSQSTVRLVDWFGQQPPSLASSTPRSSTQHRRSPPRAPRVVTRDDIPLLPHLALPPPLVDHASTVSGSSPSSPTLFTDPNQLCELTDRSIDSSIRTYIRAVRHHLRSVDRAISMLSDDWGEELTRKDTRSDTDSSSSPLTTSCSAGTSLISRSSSGLDQSPVCHNGSQEGDGTGLCDTAWQSFASNSFLSGSDSALPNPGRWLSEDEEEDKEDRYDASISGNSFLRSCYNWKDENMDAVLQSSLPSDTQRPITIKLTCKSTMATGVGSEARRRGTSTFASDNSLVVTGHDSFGATRARRPQLRGDVKYGGRFEKCTSLEEYPLRGRAARKAKM